MLDPLPPKAQRVYLASPYSHKDAAVRAARFDAVCDVTAMLLDDGLAVYSPILQGHTVVPKLLHREDDHGFWMGACLPFIESCDMVGILTINGWRESKGVAMEVLLAMSMGIRVFAVALNDDDRFEDVSEGQITEYCEAVFHDYQQKHSLLYSETTNVQ